MQLDPQERQQPDGWGDPNAPRQSTWSGYPRERKQLILVILAATILAVVAFEIFTTQLGMP
jgi:hypothetical protein